MANNFWSNAALEPKRQFRFILQLSPLESYVITKVNRPSFEIGSLSINLSTTLSTIPVELLGMKLPSLWSTPFCQTLQVS